MGCWQNKGLLLCCHVVVAKLCRRTLQMRGIGDGAQHFAAFEEIFVYIYGSLGRNHSAARLLLLLLVALGAATC